MAEKDDDENKNLASVSGKFHGIFPEASANIEKQKPDCAIAASKAENSFI